MSVTKSYFQAMKSAKAIALALCAYMSCSTPAQAKIANPVVLSQAQAVTMLQTIGDFILPRSPDASDRGKLEGGSLLFNLPLPPGSDAPSGRRRGGATRGGSNLALTALVPGNLDKSFLTFTVAEYPTFWFYVPEAFTTSQSIEFVLQDTADNYIYKTTFTSPKTPGGVVGVSLPPWIAPLKIGEQYHWTFVFYYNPQKLSDYVAVDGLVERVAPDFQLRNQLKNVRPQKLTALYAAYGIWQDALTNLAELRRQNPQDATLTSEWVNLLQSVGLDNIASVPVIKCCTASKNLPKPTQQ